MTYTVFESDHIISILDFINPKTLLVLDIDNTIIRPAQTIGSEHWEREVFNNLKLKGKSHQEAEDFSRHLWCRVQNKTKVLLVDDRTPDLLKKLREKGVMIVGLSSRSLGLEDLTHKQLQSLDVSLPFSERFSSELMLNTPALSRLFHGIVFCGQNSKGTCLMALMFQYSLNPQNIVFLDDRDEHILNVGQTLQERSIPYTGIRYSKMDHFNQNYNQDIANMQVQYIDQVLTDAEAKFLLKKNIRLD